MDNNPVVLAHARALMVSRDEGATAHIDADLRDTDRILAAAAELLDFSQPVAITLLAILHAIPDADDPHAIVAKLVGALPAGSYLAVSHSGSDLFALDTKDTFSAVINQTMQRQYMARSREQIDRFSRAWTWRRPVWRQSRNGAQTPPRPTRARRPCTAR